MIALPHPTANSASFQANICISDGSGLNKCIGRSSALAQAQPLDAPYVDVSESSIIARDAGGSEAQGDDILQERPSKRQKSCHQEYTPPGVPPAASLPIADKIAQSCVFPVSCDGSHYSSPSSPSVTMSPSVVSNLDLDGSGYAFPQHQSMKMASSAEQDNTEKHDVKEQRSTSSVTIRTYNRGRTRWTDEEIEYLLKGVTIYGTGRWKNILEHPHLHFHEGRTAADLKDRFRVCFPSNAPHRWSRHMPEAEEEDDDDPPPSAEESLPKLTRVYQRARKRHWTKKEDDELLKGFQGYGFNWDSIVKDPSLKFDDRSAGQARDRFRVKYKELYAQPAVARIPPKKKKTSVRAKSSPSGTSEPVPKGSSKSNQPNGKIGKSTSGQDTIINEALVPSFPHRHSDTEGDGEHDDSGSSNAGSSSDYEPSKRLTLAPLAWEDMATRPIFPFD